MTKPASVASAAVLATLLFSTASSLHAEDSEMAALRQQLKELKNLVLDLQARIIRLEDQRAGAAASGIQKPSPSTAERSGVTEAQRPAIDRPARVESGAAAAPQVQASLSREGWLKVRDGMTQAEINKLVGPPHKTFMLNGKTVWYYVYPGVGAGSVFFNADGRASSYQMPPVVLLFW